MNQRNPELFTQRATEYELESSLPYLLNRAGTRIGLTFNEDVARYRLTVPAWRVLASLYARAEQTVSELAAHTSIELSSVSRLAAELAQRGLVTRSPSGADGRAIQLSLTPAGLDVTAQIIPVAQLYERIGILAGG